MARHERSAGFVLFRLDESNRRLYLLLDYGKHWDYPKGHLEKGEDELTAARRELKEETGITQIKIIEGFRHDIEYYFHSSRNGNIRKQVAFFIAKTDQTDVILSEEHLAAEFLPFDKAMERLTFDSAKQVLQKAEQFLLDQQL